MIKKLYGFPEDPSDQENVKCLLCDNYALNLDEYCDEHQKCYYCNEREECDCKDCKCGMRLDEDHPMCSICLS